MSPLPEFVFQLHRNPVVAVGIPVGLGMLSGYVSHTQQGSKSAWYTSMQQPYGAPPKAAFAPVWTLLYAGMGYSAHLAVKSFDAAITPEGTHKADVAIQLYLAQLGLNLLWSPLFFGAKQKELALVNIAALTGTTIAMTVAMSDLYTTPVSTNWFLVPYCLWLGYATYLNAGIVWNSRTTGKDI